MSRCDNPEGGNILVCYVSPTNAISSVSVTLKSLVTLSPSFRKYAVEFYGADDVILHLEEVRRINGFRLSSYSVKLWPGSAIIL